MTTLFLICAVIGGTVFVFQFAMALIGIGAEDLDFGDAADGVDVDFDADFDADAVADSQGDVFDHGSTGFFGVLSFRTIVAALAFFGVAGMAATSGGLDQPAWLPLVIAVAAGVAAMYGVHWLMRSFYRLGHDGTVRLGRAVGARGTVYIPIPPQGEGTGKVQLQLQGRIVECQATTTEPQRLPTGTKVQVVKNIGPITVCVEPTTAKAAAD